MGSLSESQDHATVNRWLQVLSEKTGLSLRLDAQGVCAIGHASEIDCIVEVPDGSAALYLRANLLPWYPGTHGPLAERLLAEHFLGIGTHGATFAIDRSEGQLVMWLARRLAALNEHTFGLLIAEFLDTAAQWRDTIESSAAPETTPRASIAPSDSAPLRPPLMGLA